MYKQTAYGKNSFPFKNLPIVSKEVFYKLFIIVCCVICVLPLLRRAAADSAIQYFNSQTERAYTHLHCLCNFQTLSIVQKNMIFIPCCNSTANIRTPYSAKHDLNRKNCTMFTFVENSWLPLTLLPTRMKVYTLWYSIKWLYFNKILSFN